jgi:hypothetical protein
MTGSVIPIRREATLFQVDGARRRPGLVLLHPDGLAAMITRIAIWGYCLGVIVFIAAGAFLFPNFSDVAMVVAIGIPGGFLGRFVARGLATRKAAKKLASGGGGMTVMPFESIAGFRVRPSAGINGSFGFKDLLVETADGTEYAFAGIGKWQADLVNALTARGSDVHTATRGMLVTAQVTHQAASPV